MIIPGKVTTINQFGAFVDIGVKQDGLVHVSEIANRYISDPAEVLKLNDKVLVKVTEVDLQRKRIALSIKQGSEGTMPKAEGVRLKAKGENPKAFNEIKKSPATSMEDALNALKKKFKN